MSLPNHARQVEVASRSKAERAKLRLRSGMVQATNGESAIVACTLILAGTMDAAVYPVTRIWIQSGMIWTQKCLLSRCNDGSRSKLIKSLALAVEQASKTSRSVGVVLVDTAHLSVCG